MPYKHIAAHLRKTELACRLHFHQMSYGAARRKRTGSMSSTGSANYTPISAIRDSSPEHTPFTNLSPVASPPSSPESTHSKPTYISASPNQQQRPHIPILPKPVPSPPHQYSGPPGDFNKSLRLDTYNLSPKLHHYQAPVNQHHSQAIDQNRLRTIYAAHRISFWSQIATEYGSSFSPSQLEEAFLSAGPSLRGTSPPTPGPSPQSAGSSAAGLTASFSAPALTALEGKGGFSAINVPTPISLMNTSVSAPSPVERCAVSALLTEEKDVRAPRDSPRTEGGHA
jgi:hypothetical protein